MAMIKEFSFLELFQEFISATKAGKRVKRDGTRYSAATTRLYLAVYDEIGKFTTAKQLHLRILSSSKFSRRQLATESRYWAKFYKAYTEWLYGKGAYDNYVGAHVKVIKTFLSYLKNQKHLPIGDFYKGFYVRREEIPIIVFTHEQFQFLINDAAFASSLPAYLQKAKDIIVFGSTVGLRYTDLMALTKANIHTVFDSQYLKVTSKKTKAETVVKLPDYAIAIIQKYRRNKTLLPYLSNARLNICIKELCERAGWVHEISKTRTKRGKTKKVTREKGASMRFCDLVTTHTMRKTAITTLLTLGVPETVVRRISGHSPGSKEFYKYVTYSQHFIDSATDQAFDRLSESIRN